MPTEAEIRTRAMQEFQMALEIGQIRRRGSWMHERKR